jgi:TolB-like protein
MAADVVGYSRLMGLDEEGTLAALKNARRELVDPKIEAHQGRILRTMGDGLLVEFDNAVDAVRCAVELQQAMPTQGAALPLDRRIRFRIAIDMGDVIEDGDIIHGDAVDVAARMEALAEPGGVNVSGAVRDEVRGHLEIDYRDLGEHKVERVARPVRVFRVVLDPSAPATAAKPRAAAHPEKPSLAVLPFQNLGGGGEAEFFLDSVAEDLITELARARWFSVVARNTSFTYKGKGADSKQLGRELGVRYVVEGSLRKAGNRVRIGCQLVEAESGQHLWAERFDGTLEDSFDLQDRITESVIGATGPVLRLAEIERARRKSDAALDVYDLTLRALPSAFAETAADNDAAMRLLERVVQIDPRYPTANALAAWCLQQRYLMKWPGRQADDRETARRLARTAIAEGGDAPLALAVGGAVHAALTRDHDLALAAVDRAAMINPNAAAVLGFDALTRCLCGAYDRAVGHAEKALRLSPLEPLVYHASLALALARLFTGQPDEAVEHARRAIAGNRYFAFPYCVEALAAARLDRIEEAADAVRRLLAAAPGFRIESLLRIRFADAARLKPDIELLRRAQLPD